MAKKTHPARSTMCVQPASPDKAVLEAVPNPHPDADQQCRCATPLRNPATALPHHGPAQLRPFRHRLCPEQEHRQIQVAEALSHQLPQCRQLPRSHHHRHRQAHRDHDQAALPAHRPVLVSPRRYSHRRVLADRQAAEGRLAARYRRRFLSGQGWLLIGRAAATPLAVSGRAVAPSPRPPNPAGSNGSWSGRGVIARRLLWCRSGRSPDGAVPAFLRREDDVAGMGLHQLLALYQEILFAFQHDPELGEILVEMALRLVSACSGASAPRMTLAGY